MSAIGKAHECWYCKIVHKDVEGSGIWFCPNPLCPGSGGATHRMKCSSFSPTGNGRHTVDIEEWCAVGLRLARETGDLVVIAAAQQRAKEYLREAMAEEEMERAG